MKEENESVEEKTEQEDNKKDNFYKGFFKKMWYSITNIDKYPEMAAEGLGRAFTYLAKIVAILTIVLCLGMLYQTHIQIKNFAKYLQQDFPDFSYKDGILEIYAEQPIDIEEDISQIGKTIIDTKTENQEEINQYIELIEQNNSGVIILKDRVILKNSAVSGTISYNYKQTFSQMSIEQFDKNTVINYINSAQIFTLYMGIFIIIFIYGFIMYIINTLMYALLVSFFGYLTTWIAKIRMRYVAVFNMSVYALTLSILLNIIYIVVNTFIDFTMQYFEAMYISVAVIYVAAAIFILKSEFMKKQAELIKIAEAQAIVKKEMEKQDKEEKEKENKDTGKEEQKDEKKENKKQEKKGKDEEDGEGQIEGSNA